MARGMKPANPLYEADSDLLEHLEMVEAIGNGATIEPDAPVRRLTAVSFSRLAEVAVEQNTSVIRQGNVGKFRNRSRKLIEASLSEECIISGMRQSLNLLFNTGEISRDVYIAKLALFQSHYEDMWRTAARCCAQILLEIEAARLRKGKSGRPSAAPNDDALARLIDSEILRDAANDARPHNDRDVILANIPVVVRNYLRHGQLRHLGETDQESVDRHSKRIRAHFMSLVENPPRGGSSVIRKVHLP